MRSSQPATLQIMRSSLLWKWWGQSLSKLCMRTLPALTITLINYAVPQTVASYPRLLGTRLLKRQQVQRSQTVCQFWRFTSMRAGTDIAENEHIILVTVCNRSLWLYTSATKPWQFISPRCDVPAAFLPSVVAPCCKSTKNIHWNSVIKEEALAFCWVFKPLQKGSTISWSAYFLPLAQVAVDCRVQWLRTRLSK